MSSKLLRRAWLLCSVSLRTILQRRLFLVSASCYWRAKSPRKSLFMESAFRRSVISFFSLQFYWPSISSRLIIIIEQGEQKGWHYSRICFNVRQNVSIVYDYFWESQIKLIIQVLFKGVLSIILMQHSQRPYWQVWLERRGGEPSWKERKLEEVSAKWMQKAIEIGNLTPEQADSLQDLYRESLRNVPNLCPHRGDCYCKDVEIKQRMKNKALSLVSTLNKYRGQIDPIVIRSIEVMVQFCQGCVSIYEQAERYWILRNQRERQALAASRQREAEEMRQRQQEQARLREEAERMQREEAERVQREEAERVQRQEEERRHREVQERQEEAQGSTRRRRNAQRRPVQRGEDQLTIQYCFRKIQIKKENRNS